MTKKQDDTAKQSSNGFGKQNNQLNEAECLSRLPAKTSHVAQNAVSPNIDLPAKLPRENGGQSGLDPTRYGDWEKKGRCTDFYPFKIFITSADQPFNGTSLRNTIGNTDHHGLE